MVDANADCTGSGSRSIIKISFDLEKGSADNIEMAEEVAREEHFEAGVARVADGISPSEEPEGDREAAKPTRSSLTAQSHSTDGGSPPTSQNKSQAVAKLSSNCGFNQGRWSDAEHQLFLEGIDQFGKDWKKVEEYVGTRSSTQARSHAQKVLPKLEGYKELASPKKHPTAGKLKQAEVFSPFEKCTVPVFRVEKDCTRIQARKRLLSTSQPKSNLCEFTCRPDPEEAKSEAPQEEQLSSPESCPTTNEPEEPVLTAQPTSAVTPHTDSFDYAEPPQRRFTMNPHEAAQGNSFPAPRKRVQSDAPMLIGNTIFDLPAQQQVHHPMDDQNFHNPFGEEPAFTGQTTGDPF